MIFFMRFAASPPNGCCHGLRRGRSGRNASTDPEQAAPADRSSRMTVNTSAFAKLLLAPAGLGRRLASLPAFLPRPAVRDLLVAGGLVLAAKLAVPVQERLQDWIPEVLTVPNDAQVITDRAIGSTIRMFSIATDVDVDALFADWEASLDSNGYPVSQGADDLLDRPMNSPARASPTPRSSSLP
ncbi:hypothetical protein [Jannaschia formosa]|uniref:hypothetical protein n=1 Tax=Jannaschia formosa TaxID=2259592 RepID=UPI0010752EB1|nr:hypothetical protein [Jannaschia formosa]TFL16194.1 hypothetical protein DR046_21335 [Jannaschia formosa]